VAHANDVDRVDLARVAQHDDRAEALGLEVLPWLVEGQPQSSQVTAHGSLVHDPPGPAGIAREDDVGRQVEDDRYGR
jgi:hypothetical protein